jgi:very-short-patch-repair endonuclease
MWPKTEGAACEALEARGEAVDRQRVWELSYGFICTDLYLPAHRLVVELDGECHDSTRDSDRDSELSAMGVTVLRIPDTGVPEEAADAVVGAFLRATA